MKISRFGSSEEFQSFSKTSNSLQIKTVMQTNGQRSSPIVSHSLTQRTIPGSTNFQHVKLTKANKFPKITNSMDQGGFDVTIMIPFTRPKIEEFRIRFVNTRTTNTNRIATNTTITNQNFTGCTS